MLFKLMLAMHSGTDQTYFHRIRPLSCWGFHIQRRVFCIFAKLFLCISFPIFVYVCLLFWFLWSNVNQEIYKYFVILKLTIPILVFNQIDDNILITEDWNRMTNSKRHQIWMWSAAIPNSVLNASQVELCRYI